MRTFRKALCLVMAMLFVLGLCTIGAGAAYTDDAKINYKDAVTVMTGLGIIQGDDNDGDGKMEFRPTDNVKRAEAAKMITYMVLGATNAEKLPSGEGVFSDVPAGAWYTKYVNFCYQRGYIKGMGDGTFAPNANVTGVQLATMLLRACGYGVMGEYEGKGWDVNAVFDALTEGVYEDAETEDFSAPATREECALYVFNTLTTVEQVKWDVDVNRYLDYDDPWGEKVWDLESTDPVQITENQATGAVYTVAGGENYKLDTGLDLIAHKAKIYYRNIEKKDADGKTYYVAYLAEDLSATVSAGGTQAALYKNVKAAGANVKTIDTSKAVIWENYVEGEDNETKYDIAAMKDVNVGFNPLKGELILDEKGEALAVMTSKYTVMKVKAIDDEDGAITMTENDVIKGADFNTANAYEGIKKGDLVTVIPCGTLYKIEPTSTVEVDVFEANSKRLTYNNNAYAYKSTYIGGDRSDLVTGKTKVDAASVQAGWTVKFYLDSKGSVFAVETVKVRNLAGQVLLIKNWEKEIKGKPASISDEGYEIPATKDVTKYYVTVINEAGETVVYEVAEESTLAQGVYRVYLDNDIAELEEVSGEFAKGGTKYLKNDGKNYFINDDTVIYNVTENTKKGTVTAKEISKLLNDTTTVFATVNANDDLQTVWYLNGTIKEETVASSYMYISAAATAKAGYKWVDVDGDGEEEESPYYNVYIDGTLTKQVVIKNAKDIAEGFFTYKGSNGIYTITKVTKNVQVNAELNDGDIHDGDWYFNGADGVSVSGLKVVNLTMANDGKDYLKIASVDDIEELLADYTVAVSYVEKNSSTKTKTAPNGVLYVTAVTALEAESAE